jgi:DNA polymerase I-like protein with 3'-5' exonuclease and polymerase domains
MLQLGTPDGDQFVIDMRQIDVEPIKRYLEGTNTLFIGHNIKFDYNVLKRLKILLNRVYDTMVVDQVIHNGRYSMIELMRSHRFSLNGVYYFYYGTSIEKETRQQFHSISDQPFTEQQIRYGALDVVYPFEIKKKQEELIEKAELQTCVDLENKVLLSLGDIEYNGFNLNKMKWLDINAKYKLRILETTQQLDDLLLSQDNTNKYVSNAYQMDLFSPDYENHRTSIVNWGSDKQVYEILSSVFNINPVDKHNKNSSGANAIELLDQRYPITDLILKLRKEEKAVSSFGLDYIEKYHGVDGRIRTTYNQIVETGRISSRNPNLQQIPKEEEFRLAFDAPEGRKIVTADYSAQEARIMADRANDETYINFFLNDGGDIHSFVATTMFTASFGKEFIVTSTNENKAYRSKGKTINFAISFGGSAYALSKSLKIPESEAQDLIDAFFKGFPKLKAMFDSNKEFALQYGFIRTNDIIKRIRHFRYWDQYKELLRKKGLNSAERSELMKLKGRIERRALNTPIQGTASDMMKLALVYIRQSLIGKGCMPYDNNAKIKLVNVVHDECSVECTEDLAEETAKIQKESMEKAGAFLVKSMPMTAKPVIKNHWDH